jgi:selenocysteine lyase/cysteine desulfurase
MPQWIPLAPWEHIVSIAHATRTQEAAAALSAQDITCGTRGGRMRISLAPYNDESDVRRLAGALLSS